MFALCIIVDAAAQRRNGKGGFILSIGDEEGQEYLLFHSDLNVAVDSELNIYVLDIKNHRLLKFDKMGAFIWETGRREGDA
jgi:hypothetical protein